MVLVVEGSFSDQTLSSQAVLVAHLAPFPASLPCSCNEFILSEGSLYCSFSVKGYGVQGLAPHTPAYYGLSGKDPGATMALG